MDEIVGVVARVNAENGQFWTLDRGVSARNSPSRASVSDQIENMGLIGDSPPPRGAMAMTQKHGTRRRGRE